MSELKIEILKKIIENIPDDYSIYFEDKIISDNFEIDVSNQKIILKKY